MASIERVLNSCGFIRGEEVPAFEKEFSDYLGTEYCVGVSSGTDALVLAMEALGVCPGDEVALPANTFIATAMAVYRVGATPVFIDVDRDTLNMSLQDLSEKTGKQTKAIIPVHLYGYPAEMEGTIV
jgi:dTDP-4-amino-4,6-dideoxygalactose transaminase